MEVTESSVLQLPFTASSVGVARRHLVSDLIEAGVCTSAVTDAALVISELLSNALQHAGPLPGCGYPRRLGPGRRQRPDLGQRRRRVHPA